LYLYYLNKDLFLPLVSQILYKALSVLEHVSIALTPFLATPNPPVPARLTRRAEIGREVPKNHFFSNTLTLSLDLTSSRNLLPYSEDRKPLLAIAPNPFP
ncbi:MAG: hypothetical protein ACUVTY_15395, partial [Armatimonadota bacterium]